MKINKDEERYYIMIKWPTYQKHITILNVHSPNIVSKYMKQNWSGWKEKKTNPQWYVGSWKHYSKELLDRKSARIQRTEQYHQSTGSNRHV